MEARFHPRRAAWRKASFKVISPLPFTQGHAVLTPAEGTRIVRRELKVHAKPNLQLQPCSQTALSLLLQKEAAELPTTRNYFYFSK